MKTPEGETRTQEPLDSETYQQVVKVRWSIPPAVRTRLELRDRGTCRYCGEPGDQIDHVVPIAMGGSNRISNLVLACQPCNSRKGASVWRPA